MTCLEFNSNIGAKVRIWLDEIPTDAVLLHNIACEKHIFDGRLNLVNRKRAAIEVFRPVGPSFQYGLLGAEYQSDNGIKLDVNIPIDTHVSDNLYRDSLANSLDIVTVGGLVEYADAIRSGIDDVNANSRPCGIINITCMAYGEIGSSPIIFRSLARALIFILCRSNEPSSLDETMALLDA